MIMLLVYNNNYLTTSTDSRLYFQFRMLASFLFWLLFRYSV